MARTVTFYYDILSPFAHIALARLRELPSDVVVTPKPVLLGAILTHWGQRGPAEIGPKRIHTYRQAVHLGSRYGVPLRFPPRHPFNPLAALRILAGADADLVMVGRAFDFVFGQGRAVDTAEDVIAFAQMLGVSAGLGYFILDTRDRLAYSELMAMVLLIGVLGFMLDALARGLYAAWRHGAP